jgi:hypothetical protein
MPLSTAAGFDDAEFDRRVGHQKLAGEEMSVSSARAMGALLFSGWG